jgi:hypothetical protein
MYCSIDIQGYSGLHEFQYITPKEVGIKYRNGRSRLFHVKPFVAYPLLNVYQQRIVHWATLKYHGLSYGTGYLTQKEFEEEIVRATSGCEVVITKGKQKKEYLQRLIKNRIVDAETLGCPTIRNALNVDCVAHQRTGARCAKAGAEFLHKWYNGYLGSTTSAQKNKQDDREQVPSRGVSCQPCTEKDPKARCVCS